MPSAVLLSFEEYPNPLPGACGAVAEEAATWHPPRPGRGRPASIRRDPARTRLRSGPLRAALPGPLPGPQPPLVLDVPLRKPHQGPPPSGAYTRERPEYRKLTEESSAHSGDLIRKAGPGTLSRSFACTGCPRSQRNWTSTCPPHSRCRASTAAPSGSARYRSPHCSSPITAGTRSIPFGVITYFGRLREPGSLYVSVARIPSPRASGAAPRGGCEDSRGRVRSR